MRAIVASIILNIAVLAILVLPFLWCGTIAYVVIHFVAKYW